MLMQTQPATLPLWRTIVISYAEWFRYFPDIIRVTAFWIVLLAITMGVADWLKWSMALSTIADLKAGNPKDPGFALIVTGALYVFSAAVFILALIDVAVSWHRRVILNDVPKLLGNVGNTYYWRYFAKLLALFAVAAAPLVLLLGPIILDTDFELPIEFDVTVPVIASLYLLTVLGIFVRLSFVLPVEATSRPLLKWIDSWRVTRGHTWRLMIGLAVCGIAPGFVTEVMLESGGLVRSEMSPIEILITAGAPDTFIKSAIGDQVSVACALAFLPIGVGFLSHCYQQLAQK